jgi:hypothetical protein
MYDGVSPRIQRFQGRVTSRVSTVERVHPMPETDPQSSEVRSQIAGVGVAVVELAALDEQVLDDRAEHGWRESANDDRDRLCVEIPAEALKLRRE